MGNSIENITSKLVSIADLTRTTYRFNIPRYQRLFVWQDEQVETLLQDLYEAFNASKDLYYLGGILVVLHKDEDEIFDLIDGQQRFTALWLLSLELGGTFEAFSIAGDQLRLKFSIRQEAAMYFELAKHPDEKIDFEITKENSSLINIDRARGRISSFIDQKLTTNQLKEEFGKFILYAVKIIVTEVPKNTDLNKLFEVINNRGQQLEHHEILKAKILSKIENKQERHRYGKVWNACADMGNYIERNLQFEVGLNLSAVYDVHAETFSWKWILDLLKRKKTKVTKEISLNNILQGKSIEYEEDNGFISNFNEDHPEARDEELEPVRSILSFPQLLLHVLRIYFFQHGGNDIPRINEKELLVIFADFLKTLTESESKTFIELLWEVRICFDLYIIKWVKIEEDEEVHLIKRLEKYNQPRKHTYYLRRRKVENNEGFALLQSMLYHSQQITTHYWLTPLLFKALKNRNRNSLFDYLRKLDNALFCSGKLDTLSERTWAMMGKELPDPSNSYNSEDLDKTLGVSFPHYWFYKLEFVLWYLKKDSEDDCWKKFKMTAKNSVEHVSPQTPEYKQDTVSENFVNRFGNLALVSRSINSGFGNKPFRSKREQFLYSNFNKLDSLKLSLIYKNSIWNDILCENHENEMKSFLKEYFNRN